MPSQGGPHHDTEPYCRGPPATFESGTEKIAKFTRGKKTKTCVKAGANIKTKHNVAVVGLGKISDAHMLGWNAAKEANVQILVDTDRARAESKAREYHVPEFGTEFEALLGRRDIDIIDLVVPHYLHAPYSVAALKAGKHVFVEKPIATKLSDAEDMIKTAKATGKKLMVAEPIRLIPATRVPPE